MFFVYKLVIEKFGEKWMQSGNIVINGVYILKDWVVNEWIVMECNLYYWDNVKIVINIVIWLLIFFEVIYVNCYCSGELDMIYNQLLIEFFQKLKKEIFNELYVDFYLCIYYYEINNQKVLFIDVCVCIVLKLGLDCDIIVNKVKGQGDLLVYGYMLFYIDGVKLSELEWFIWLQEKCNEEVKKLLVEVGYSVDKLLIFNLLYNIFDLYKKLVIVVVLLWCKNLGIDVKLVNQEWKMFFDICYQGIYDVVCVGWCVDYNELIFFLNIMFFDSLMNIVYYKSLVFDKIMVEFVKVFDEVQCMVVYVKVEQQLDKDSVIVLVYYYVNVCLVKLWVGGYIGKDLMDNVYIKDFYVIKY